MAKSGHRRISIDGGKLTLEQVEAIADGATCRLAPVARRRVRASRQVVNRAVRSGRQVYGVNTGFGELSQVRIDDDKLDELQRNLVRSHAAGVGDPLPERTVRAILALRVNCLVRGHSGLRLETVQRMIDLLDHGLHPFIPRHGSVGASGDLAPLAHVALTLIGEGEFVRDGRRVSARAALRRAGLTPLVLEAKEGLALINGTQVMTAIGLLALLDAERLARLADLAGAMTLEALRGSHRAFDRRIHAARSHPGQRASAAHLRRLLRGSDIVRAHRDCGRVQDAYSLRCIPQVHGAVRDAQSHVRGVLEREVNASTDNPMVFVDQDEMLSGGNFHGQPVSLALDFLGAAICSLATISERRIERLVNPSLSGLPAFLTPDPGLHSGFMIAHVTAASLVAENKILAHPASVDTIPTSAAKEDHVSMGVHAARKAAEIVDHVGDVLAIEFLCGAQALEFVRPLRSSPAVEAAYRTIRRRVPPMNADRVLYGEIETVRGLVDGGALETAVKRALA